MPILSTRTRATVRGPTRNIKQTGAPLCREYCSRRSRKGEGLCSLDTARLWLCPSARPPTTAPPGTAYRSYGYNGFGLSTDSAPGAAGLGLGGHYVGNAGPDGSIGPPVRDSEVARPSMMMVLGDGLEGGKGIVVDGLTLLRRNDGMRPSPDSTARAVARHMQRANVAFADGHVDSLRLKSLFEENSDAALSRWNRDDRPHPELLAQ